MHALNGSCQTTPSNASTINNSQSAQNGNGDANSNGDVETLHPLTYNNHHSTLNYNNLKNSDKYLLNNGHQCQNHSNNHQMPSFTSGQRDILRLIGQHLRYLGLSYVFFIIIMNWVDKFSNYL